MTDELLHDALVRHAIGAHVATFKHCDLSGIPLIRMLEVEARYQEEFHVAERAIAAIYVAFNYEGEPMGADAGECSPILVANGNAIFCVKTPKKDLATAATSEPEAG